MSFETIVDVDFLWVLKVPTDLSPTILYPTQVDNGDFTSCVENESMYDGNYPLSSYIIEYKTVENKSIIVPYFDYLADAKYGFYEFDTLKELKKWVKENTTKSIFLIKDFPEWFI